MKLLYLHVRDSQSLYKDTCIHFDPKWRGEEKGKAILCSRAEGDALEEVAFAIAIMQGKLAMDTGTNKRFLKKGNYFAIYIDLLGQKNLYSGISPSGCVGSEGVLRELLQVNYVMRLGYEHLRDFLPQFIRRSGESLNLYRQNGYSKYLEMSESEFRQELERLCFGTQQFSDSLRSARN